MKLYEEILFLQQYTKNTNIKYVVENVKGWYEPLVEPQAIGRHYFWSNLELPPIKIVSNSTGNNKGMTLQKKMDAKGVNITDWHKYKGDWHKYKGDKRTLLNNCVEEELGRHILNCYE
jgi:DNA (cytosine-5)-methyltransferase 1